MTGRVASFDQQVGLGEIVAADGATVHFHCIAIGDGTRTVEVGAEVEFELVAKLGRYEATRIRPVPAGR
jgi:cold shock CspA family protein